MAAQNSQGIQILLEAEKEASKIVQKGRQYRIQKLKDAKTEAQKEIYALKAQKQSEFESLTKGVSGLSLVCQLEAFEWQLLDSTTSKTLC